MPPKPPAPTPPPVIETPDPILFVGQAEGEAVIPLEGAQQKAAVPMGDPIPPFALKVHPRRWTVMGGHVVPLAGRVRHMPGANGADAIYDRDGKFMSVDLSIARQKAENSGWTIIPYDRVPRSLCPGGSYLYRPKGRPDMHLLFTERVYAGSKHVDGDVATYVKWMLWLMQPGPNGEAPTVAPPPLYILAEMAEKTQSLLDAASNKAVQFPSYKAIAEQHERDLAVIRAEIEKRQSALAPAAGEAVIL